jgi:hypothetical protein
LAAGLCEEGLLEASVRTLGLISTRGGIAMTLDMWNNDACTACEKFGASRGGSGCARSTNCMRGTGCNWVASAPFITGIAVPLYSVSSGFRPHRVQRCSPSPFRVPQ